jgi:hypothetical protein
MYSMSGPSSSSLLSGLHQSWDAASAVEPAGASATSASPSSSTSTEAQVSGETCIVGLPPPNNAEQPAGSRACLPPASLRAYWWLDCYRVMCTTIPMLGREYPGTLEIRARTGTKFMHSAAVESYLIIYGVIRTILPELKYPGS